LAITTIPRLYLAKAHPFSTTFNPQYSLNPFKIRKMEMKRIKIKMTEKVIIIMMMMMKIISKKMVEIHLSHITQTITF
jgi:hypothetical protein